MLVARILGVLFLIALWSGVIWILVHHRRIESALAAESALPRPASRGTVVFLIGLTLFTISALLLYVLFG